jgi:CRP-like cAMP-binding protein/flavin-dependent dehydrogenase
VGVLGSGPAGSFFAYFFLDIAHRFGLDVKVDLIERKDFGAIGPAGCNHCGGIISESLVQTLAMEGITLPDSVVKRGIDSYILRVDEGHVRIRTLQQEMRIAAVHRGAGPRGSNPDTRWRSFDGFLQRLALDRGAHLVRGRVDEVRFVDGRPQVKIAGSDPLTYDLLVVAAGVNSPLLKSFEGLPMEYRAPVTTKAYVCEHYLGREAVERHLGSSMHMFLLNLPRLKFAALIPKEDHVTLCILGHDIDPPLVRSFLEMPEARGCFPPGWAPPPDHCKCSPRLDLEGAARPFADRLVFVGDAAISRLYKDGINAAFRTAKAAAVTAVCEGISAADFRRHYWPTCRSISRDNQVGKLMFAVTSQIQKRAFARRGLLRITTREQAGKPESAIMSRVLWDMFTGSASYSRVFMRTLSPVFIARVGWNMACSVVSRRVARDTSDQRSAVGGLGRVYEDGEVIVRQGEVGHCMYVVQAGQVEVVREAADGSGPLAELGKGEVFGEMALIDDEVRSATVRAKGRARVLTVDKHLFLKKIHEDPSLALRTLGRMSQRIREMDAKIERLLLAGAQSPSAHTTPVEEAETVGAGNAARQVPE